jgi:hypothetical protein
VEIPSICSEEIMSPGVWTATVTCSCSSRSVTATTRAAAPCCTAVSARLALPAMRSSRVGSTSSCRSRWRHRYPQRAQVARCRRRLLRRAEV